MATPRKILDQIWLACRTHKTVIASPEIKDALDDASFFRRLTGQGLDWRVGENTLEELLSLAIVRATILLYNSPDGVHYDTIDGAFANVLVLVEGAVTGEMPARGIRFDTWMPGQKGRLGVLDGQTVIVSNGASDAEKQRLAEYWRWQTSVEEGGGTVQLYGRSRKSRQEFYELLEEGLKRCAGARLTQELLSGHMGMDAHTLRGYFNDYGPPWKTLKQYKTLSNCEAHGWKRS